MQRWQIGDVTITKIIELEVTGGTRFILPDATRDAVQPISWLQPNFADEAGNLVTSVHALVIETPTRQIIVDTCIGNDKPRNIPSWNMLQLPFLEDLGKAGYDRLQIDTVLCTHLHVDHVGWNTMWQDNSWVPTFPNADYLMAEQEFNYWIAQDEPNFGDVIGDSVRPVFDAGLVKLVDLNYQVCEEVSLEPTLGHTPGHVSVNIRSKGHHAVITGDCIHHPCQFARNDWCSSADYDAKEAMQTRTELFERLVDSETLVIGTHFPTPTAGYLKRDDVAYWLDTDIGDQFIPGDQRTSTLD